VSASAHRLRRELTGATHIPYTAQVSPTVVCTHSGDFIQVLRLAGAAFDSVDAATLDNWHERLNILWRNIASPQIALWTHLVRRREYAYPKGEFPPGFAHDLNETYRRRLVARKLLVNELYLSIVYRPHATALKPLTMRNWRKVSDQEAEGAFAQDACHKLRELLIAGLDRYDPQVLSVEAGCSQLLQFLGFLVNGEAQHFALPRSHLSDVLATSRLLFGREAIEYRRATATQFAAMLGIKEYPASTAPGAFNACLTTTYPLILTQSFTFLTKAAGQGLLQRQQHQMRNAGDFAVAQAEELKVALDQLTGNHFAFGEHHCSLQVLSDEIATLELVSVRAQLALLNERLAHARGLLADTGMVVAREDLGLEAAFWAQLPGNFSLRPRRAAITTRNFSAFAPFLNFPPGRAVNNHWGEALTQFVTAAGSPFNFSLHAGGDTGHTFLCGPTGSGKTVLIGFLIAMLVKQDVTQIVFDKDRGLEILIRALGGTYRPLRSGEPTGFNPLRLPDTPHNREFLKAWLLSLLGPSPLTATEAADLQQALDGTLALDPCSRRLSRLIEFLDPTSPEGLHARLLPWCHAGGGDRAWVFDHPEDSAADLISRTQTLGFDVTEFLGNATVRTPITLYLFHLVRARLDGRRFVCWLDEFWRMLGDPAFTRFAKDGPKTWRKLNAVMCLSTQSPSDVLDSPIARTIIEQTPTKIFFPNSQATAADYCEGFALSARELQLIQEDMEPGARQFLIKQAGQSVVCELDLKGLEGVLAVISSRAQSLHRMNHRIAQYGPDPSQWLPTFLSDSTEIKSTPSRQLEALP
jgi:type IV secretion system protein VirB4